MPELFQSITKNKTAPLKVNPQAQLPAQSQEDQSFQQAQQNLQEDEESSFQPLAGASAKNKPLGLGIPTSPGQGIERTSLNNVWDKAIDFIRPYVGMGAGTVLAIPSASAGAASPIPGGAAMGGFAGDVGGYTLADTIMQYLKTEQPQSPGEALSEGSKEALINAVGGRILNNFVKGGLAYRNAGMPEIYKLFPTSSQALEHHGIKILPQIAKAFEDIGAPRTKQIAQLRSGAASQFEALELANLMNGKTSLTNADPAQLLTEIKTRLKSGINPSATPNQFQQQLHYVSKDLTTALEAGKDPLQTLRDTIGDDKKLEKFLSLGQSVGPANMNVRQDLQAFHFSDMFNRASKTLPPRAGGVAQTKLDPEVFAQEWFNPQQQSKLTKLYGVQQKEVLDRFMERVIQTQDNPLISPNLVYKGKGFLLGGGALGTLIGGHIPAGVTAGVYIPTNILGRLLTKPGVARALSAMAGAEPAQVGKEQLGRQILSGLQGLRLALVDPSGKKNWGTVSSSGGGFDFKPEGH
jgi:hypothetical protein